jgi:peptide/nickel transport system substrate-binding protein
MVPKGAETQTVAEMIQAMAGEVGFDMKIRVTEFATGLKQAEEGSYQAFVFAWSGRPDPDGNSYSFASCGQALDYSAYCNEDVKAALAEARTATDLAARKAAYERAAKQFAADDPVIYLFHRRILIAHTTRLEGYKQMPDGLVRVIGLTLK